MCVIMLKVVMRMLQPIGLSLASEVNRQIMLSSAGCAEEEGGQVTLVTAKPDNRS